MRHQSGSLHISGLYRRFTAIRLVLCVVLVALVAGVQTMPGRACGMVTHQEVAKRALDLLRGPAKAYITNLYNSYPDAFLSGAIFPDWGSFADANGCSGCGNLSEAAHWPPFMTAYIYYLKQNSSNPLVDNPQAIAFMLGMIAHNEADIPLHFPIPGEQEQVPPLDHSIYYSFLARAIDEDGTTALPEYGCQYAGLNYHGCIEYSLDWKILFGLYNISTAWNENNLWFPYEDIQAVYQEIGLTVYSGDLDRGVAKAKQAYLGEKIDGIILHLSDFNDDVWTNANMWDYPDGGMNDMSIHVAAAWQQVYDELSTPTPLGYNLHLARKR